MTALGIRIRDRRDDLGLNRAELERAAGFGPNYIGRLERGQLPPPKYEELARLADALECSVKWLLASAVQDLLERHDPLFASLLVDEDEDAPSEDSTLSHFDTIGHIAGHDAWGERVSDVFSFVVDPFEEPPTEDEGQAVLACGAILEWVHSLPIQSRLVSFLGLASMVSPAAKVEVDAGEVLSRLFTQPPARRDGWLYGLDLLMQADASRGRRGV